MFPHCISGQLSAYRDYAFRRSRDGARTNRHCLLEAIAFLAYTALATVGYSRRLRALEIEFRNGAIYRYLEVAPEIYEALLHARSKARFYDENIRHKYRSLHVRPRAP